MSEFCWNVFGWRGWGSILVRDEEVDLHPGEEEVLEGGAEELQIVLFKPLLEEAVWEKDLEAMTGHTLQGQRPEPGLEAMVVQLALDSGKGCLPYLLG